MMTAVRAITVALVLLVPIAADAECAWVLWTQAFDHSRRFIGPYEIDLARSTRQECAAEIRAYATSMKSKGYTVSAPSHFEIIGDKGTATFKYFCLPDTVDPRGAKAK